MSCYVTYSSAPWCLTYVKPVIQFTVQRWCYSTRNWASCPLADPFSGNFCLSKDTDGLRQLYYDVIGLLSLRVNSEAQKREEHRHTDWVSVGEILMREVMRVSKRPCVCEIVFLRMSEQHGGKWKVKVTLVKVTREMNYSICVIYIQSPWRENKSKREGETHHTQVDSGTEYKTEP